MRTRAAPLWDGLRASSGMVSNFMEALQTFRSPGVRAELAIAIVGASLLSACSVDHSSAESKAASATQQSVPVVVADVLRKTVPLRVQGIGNVESLATVAVTSRVDGQIVKVHFRDGAEVTQGQVLFEIDPRQAIAQLKQTQAKLASDVAQRRHAQEQDKRYKDLLQRKFISPDGYAQYRTNLDSARANVDADRAAVENTRLQVEFATIRAPISGRAGKVMIPQGNLVKANDTNPLVVINQVSPIYVNFAVPEQYLPQIRAALRAGPAAVDISAAGGDGKAMHVSGTLAFIDNTVDVTTGTIKLRASVPNKDASLWPGQFVNAAVTLGEQSNAVVVPSEAVQMGPDGSYVFIVDGSARAQMRKVLIDRTTGQETLIANGLEGGEKVVVDGQSRLLPGTEVTIRAAGPKG